MTFWERVIALLEATRERTLGQMLERLSERRKERDSALFSIALIALSAKMAKADGVVTDDELAAFRQFFDYPAEEESKVRTIFNLATEDVAGFSSYVRQVARIFRGEPAILEDVLDCLFFVAAADEILHPNELELLRQAADAFDIDQASWRRIKAAHLGVDRDDPYVILGVEHDAPDDEIKSCYRGLAKENHPDALQARGVPADCVKIAEHRMAVINEAYEAIQAERGF